MPQNITWDLDMFLNIFYIYIYNIIKDYITLYTKTYKVFFPHIKLYLVQKLNRLISLTK